MLYLKLVLMALCWSGVFPALAILLRSMGVMHAVFLRFVAASLILLALLVVREKRLPRLSPREATIVFVLGMLGVSVYNFLFTAAMARVEASRAAVILPTNPAFTALFAFFLFRENLGRIRSLGVGLCVLGALWVIGKGDPGHYAQLDFGLGELLLVLCIFLWSAYTLLGRVALATLSPLALTACVSFAGALQLAIPAWIVREPLDAVTAQGWAALGYLAVFGTVLPFLWYYEGVKALGAARAAQFINLVPPLAVAESVLILGEPFTPALAAGTALVVAGLYLTNKPR